MVKRNNTWKEFYRKYLERGLKLATWQKVGAMALIYAILPMCEYAAMKWNKRVFLAVAITVFSVIMLDEIVNLTLKNLDQPTATDFYRSLGMKYQEF